MSMKQTERIKEMELRMQRASAALKELMAALDHFEGEKEDFAKLSDYYGSKEWKQDFEADRDGQLQEDLKRGVLSEDGLWNLLEDYHELKERLRTSDSDDRLDK